MVIGVEKEQQILLFVLLGDIISTLDQMALALRMLMTASCVLLEDIAMSSDPTSVLPEVTRDLVKRSANRALLVLIAMVELLKVL